MSVVKPKEKSFGEVSAILQNRCRGICNLERDQAEDIRRLYKEHHRQRKCLMMCESSMNIYYLNEH